MKFDTAYCLSLDDKLSIYDVRDLNFDETTDFDSDKDSFLCPNDDCRTAFDPGNALSTFNAKNVNYLRTPHFKNRTSTRHIDGCRYASTHKTAVDDSDDEREDHFPSEFVLTRRQYERQTPLASTEGSIPHDPVKAPSNRSSVSHRANDSTPDKTSVFAHPVECFVSNIDDKDKLKSMPLKIGDHTATYWTFFKKIEYLQDNKGLIYWGKIRAIKDYTSSFRIDFEKKVWLDKKPYSVNVYLSKKLIENYRKRKVFLEQIKAAVDSERALYCFFYGVTPELKQVPSKKNPEQTFGVFSANIENLDHLIIREAPGVE
ncbi:MULTISPECIES: hypothetical protein [Pseudomonas]|jgi:hypothetical protein|uniref:Uncharacterized protein n=1 Tax=Pseudomonas simiae TaxID=321846 RepID=U1TQA7_9PSED|nr:MULTISPECIES: hypothetical protein [Pseudomonas]MBD8742156.1 hypothetical protein [Pseudomonas fluorescens]AJZ94717.1 hypothetical protein PFLUOLIPICF7_14745 [Pseudomonas simiae]ERH60656.1 hypothetical protein O204_18625 [Pseudomonas simiae]KIQ12746.1 hypothetical protein RU03_10115 [Pseudomonas simiae]MBI6616325.1 hypothetical protein [Pseudomonas simiae]